MQSISSLYPLDIKAYETESDLKLRDYNAVVGTKNMTMHLCLIEVLQMAILKYKYSLE